MPPLNPGETGGRGGHGGHGFGGGIANEAVLSLASVTVAANEAHGGQSGFGGNGGAGMPPGMNGQNGLRGVSLGGGIHTFVDPGLITASNTLIGDNLTDAAEADVHGTFASASFVLLESGDGALNIADGVNGNVVGKDPKLGLLQDNGGPTPTRLPMAGSPAIDAGSNPQNLPTDQRGFTPRAFGKSADIGAVEAGATAGTDAKPGAGAGAGPGGKGGGLMAGGITVKVVKVKKSRQVVVTDSATGAFKFGVFPYGKRFRGNIRVEARDVNGDGVADAIVRRAPLKRLANVRVYSGTDGASLPGSLA